jgi:uncharacterized protein (TIGR02117 family)
MKQKILLMFLTLFLISGSQPYQHRMQIKHNSVHTIYVKSNGWHTGFIIPALELQNHFPQLAQRFGKTPYLEMGWGERGFYLADKITFDLTLAAMFWSKGSVIHIAALSAQQIEKYFSYSSIEKICLTEQDYQHLIDYIVASFYQNSAGKLVSLRKGLYGNSQFYEGFGHYHIGNTCNKWTAKGLKEAGMALNPLLKLSAHSVMNYLLEYKQSLRTGGMSSLCQ